MKLIVGLGNPGKDYEQTRHNVGFLAIDQLAGPGLKLDKPSQSQLKVADGILYAKPQTYMNNSGHALRTLALSHGLEPADILVIYDEVDLPFGSLRTRLAGGSAGHNGIKSIIEAIGDSFWRLRIGTRQESAPTNAKDFVLEQFSASEAKQLGSLWPELTKLVEQFKAGSLSEHTIKVNLPT